jgi:hypothetical protein
VKLDEDSEAVRKARAYLTQAGGLDQQLRAMVTELNRQIPSIQVADYAQNYTSVISGPSEFPGAYTKKGLALFNDLVSKGNFGGGGEACVMGATANVTQGLMDAETRERLKSLYHRQYAAAWREFFGWVQSDTVLFNRRCLAAIEHFVGPRVAVAGNRENGSCEHLFSVRQTSRPRCCRQTRPEARLWEH